MISRIDFSPPGGDEPGRVLRDLKANAMAKLQSVSLRILERDIVGRGIGVFVDDPTASDRNTDWSRKSRGALSSSGDQTRMVNDEAAIKDRSLELEVSGDVLAKYLRGRA